jgi:hypothetical protein
MMVTFSSFVSCATRATALAYASAHAPMSTFPEDKSPSALESVVVVFLEEVEFWANIALGSSKAPRRRFIFFMANRNKKSKNQQEKIKVCKTTAGTSGCKKILLEMLINIYSFAPSGC